MFTFTNCYTFAQIQTDRQTNVCECATCSTYSTVTHTHTHTHTHVTHFVEEVSLY